MAYHKVYLFKNSQTSRTAHHLRPHLQFHCNVPNLLAKNGQSQRCCLYMAPMTQPHPSRFQNLTTVWEIMVPFYGKQTFWRTMRMLGIKSENQFNSNHQANSYNQTKKASRNGTLAFLKSHNASFACILQNCDKFRRQD